MKIPVPDNIMSLIPYSRSKPGPETTPETSGTIRMSANENPLGPSPRAAEAIKNTLARLHFYPDLASRFLRQGLEKHLGVDAECIACGNGSYELLEFAVRTFVRTGDEVIIGWPSFVVYRSLVRIAEGRLVEVPLKRFRYDIDALLSAVTDRTRMIILSCPNNPTGSILTAGEADVLLQGVPETALVIMDEAYCQFVRDPGYPDFIAYLQKHSNLLILRSFSKAYGLAGLRVGYGLGSREIMEVFDRVRQPFNINAAAQVGALAALTDEQHLERTRILVHRGLDYLYDELRRMNLNFTPSEANFILIDLGRPALPVVEGLRRDGIEVRAMGDYELPNCIRVSVGLQRENEIFIDSLKKLL